jgi:16S rRNA (cytidine1402-2'-O)-methyltransferase
MVYLIPCQLLDGVTDTLPPYVLAAVQQCQVFFVENERSARRFLKSMWPGMIIDNYTWHTIHKAEAGVMGHFAAALKAGKTVGILSEAGCPGIADPGQLLVAKAQQLGAAVKPLVGPSSILLALMASGLNGQQFRFVGYPPIEADARRKALQALEELALRTGETQIFIETPYRNDQLLADMLKYLQPNTMICVAANLTGPQELISTNTVAKWRGQAQTSYHKQPVIFLIGRV